VLRSPPSSPELNDIELSWRDLKRHHLANRTFRDADHLDQAIHEAVAAMNQSRAAVGQLTPGCLASRAQSAAKVSRGEGAARE
jgi:DDE superfamily endonuclease